MKRWLAKAHQAATARGHLTAEARQRPAALHQNEVILGQVFYIDALQADRRVARLNNRKTVFLAQEDVIKGQDRRQAFAAFYIRIGVESGKLDLVLADGEILDRIGAVIDCLVKRATGDRLSADQIAEDICAFPPPISRSSPSPPYIPARSPLALLSDESLPIPPRKSSSPSPPSM